MVFQTQREWGELQDYPDNFNFQMTFKKIKRTGTFHRKRDDFMSTPIYGD